QNGGSLAEVFFNDPYLSSPTTQTVAIDINDSGLITGWYIASDKTQHSFVVDGMGKVTYIPDLSGAGNCGPVRISKANPTTGQVWVAGNCAGNRPFLYELSSGTLTELSAPGTSNLRVTAVNSQGAAVGAGLSVFLWPAGSTFSTVPTDLNANPAFAPADALNLRAIDFNDAGTVLAGYNDIAGTSYTFLLHPIP
ncbi:MAG: hypothetical protein PHF31_14690, partial [Methylobacter sp.]|nr:hypothetical protein [Methylobacter sp.]